MYLCWKAAVDAMVGVSERLCKDKEMTWKEI